MGDTSGMPARSSSSAADAAGGVWPVGCPGVSAPPAGEAGPSGVEGAAVSA